MNKARATATGRDELAQAWQEACALQHPPMRRDSAHAALMRVLALADARGVHALRRDAETSLLVVESGGDLAARKRAVKHWLAFAERRLRDHEPLQELAQMMRAVGIESASDAFRSAWASEQLDALAEHAPRDRKLSDAWSATRVPKEAHDAYRFARESLRRRDWRQAIACARVAETHKTAATRESARVILLAALYRAGTPDVALLRDTISSFLAAVKNGRKVWMFDWRTLTALAIAHHLADATLLTQLAAAWRAADPTFAATALLDVTPPVQAAKKDKRRR